MFGVYLVCVCLYVCMRVCERRSPAISIMRVGYKY